MEYRLEVRTSRPQKNMKEWIRQLEFFDRYIEYSKDQATDFNPFQKLDGNLKRNLEKFAELLVKLNLNVDDYDFMIKKSWRKNWTTAKFKLARGQCIHLLIS